MRNTFWLKIFSFLAFFYFLLLGLAGPLVIKPLIENKTPEYLNAEITIESFFFNPLTNSLTVKNLALKNPAGIKLIALDYLHTNIDILPLILFELKVDPIEIKGLKLNIKERFEPWLTLPQSDTNEIYIGLSNNTVSISAISLKNLEIKPEIYKDNSNNFTSYLEALEALEKSAENQSEDPEQKREQEQGTNKGNEDWLLSINDFRVSGASVKLFDQNLVSQESIPTKPSIDINQINLHASNISSALDKTISLKLNLALLKGRLEVEGEINPGTTEGSFNYQLSLSQLSELNPYVEHYSYAHIKSGTLDTNGKLELRPVNLLETEETSGNEEKQIQIKLQNNTGINNLQILHTQSNETLLDCQSINSENLHFVSNPEEITLALLSINTCSIYGTLNNDGTNSFQLAKSTETKNESPENEAPKESAEGNGEKKENLNLAILKLELLDSNIFIKDLTQGEKVDLSLTGINSEILEISKGAPDKTKFSLKTLVNKKAPLTIQGSGNFLNPKLSTETKVDLEKLSLLSFSPYTLKLSSRKIEQGILTLDIDTSIVENQLKSENRAMIHGLKMSRKLDVEDGGNLPIALALTVLRSPDGTLQIDVPVEGNLEDPSFSIRKQLLRTFTNIITKAATAPISLVGGVMGGSKAGSSLIIFEEQKASSAQDINKLLTKIASTLRKNPELALEIKSNLSTIESASLNAEKQLSLMTERQRLIIDGLLSQQSDKGQLDTIKPSQEDISDKPNIELRFFAR